MAEFSITLPDFATMSDLEVAEHPLASRRDGRWSALTQHMLQHFGTAKLSLNEAWAMTPQDWKCPSCHRWKLDIARLTANCVLLCQLDRHHDHLEDHGFEILRKQAPQDLPAPVLAARKRARAATLPLIVRFSKTLICNDCNAADGAIKAALGSLVPSAFSFSPVEIGLFVRPSPHQAHKLDVDAGRKIWGKVEADFRRRLAFAERMALRINKGLHDVQHIYQYDGIVEQDDAQLLRRLIAGEPGSRKHFPDLGRALLARSCANDGHGSRAGSGPLREELAEIAFPENLITENPESVAIDPGSDKRDLPLPQNVRSGHRGGKSPFAPSMAQFRTLDDKLKDRGGPWRQSGDDWNCTCCRRSKFEITRLSNKRVWTAQVMIIGDFKEEVRPEAIAFRNHHREASPIFASSKRVSVCQDCRAILTRAAKLRGGAENALSPAAITSLVGNAAAHRPHDVPDTKLEAAVAAGSAWYEAAADFWLHHEQVRGISLRVMQIEARQGVRPRDARYAAMLEYSSKGILAPNNEASHFAWLQNEDRRLRLEDRNAPPPLGYRTLAPSSSAMLSSATCDEGC